MSTRKLLPSLAFSAAALWLAPAASLASSGSSLSLDFTGGTAVAPIADMVGGWEFDVSSSLKVVALGIWDEDGDGLTNSHDVGLYTIGQTLLAASSISSGTVVPSTSSDGVWVFVDISPVFLTPGTYVVAATYTDGDADLVRVVASATPSTGVTFVSNRTGLTSSLVFPTITDDPIDDGVFGPNLLVVPIDLEFAGSFQAYHESFIGESAFPTTPERDTIAAGGLTGAGALGGTLVLNGTTAHATLVDIDGSQAALSLDAGDVGTRNFLLSVSFDDRTATGFAGTENQISLLLLGFGTNKLVTLGLSITAAGSSNSGLETPLGTGEFLLSAAAHTAIQAGARHTLEVWFDRSLDLVSSALEVEGVGRFDGPTLAGGLANDPLVFVGVLMQFQNPGPGAQMTLDVTDVEIFLEDSEKVPAAGAAARSSLALLLLLLAFWARRRYHAPQPA